MYNLFILKKPWFKIHKSAWLWYPSNFFGCIVVALSITGVVLVSIYFSSCQTRSILDILILSFPFQTLIVSLGLFVASLTTEKPFLMLENINGSIYLNQRIQAYLLLLILFIPLIIIYFLQKNYQGSIIFVFVVFLLAFVYQRLSKLK